MENLKLDRDALQSGPIMKRSCTDWWMGIVFPLFCVGIVACAVYGFAVGKPDQLLIGWDNDQHGCGFSPETQSYPYLYFPQIPDEGMIK